MTKIEEYFARCEKAVKPLARGERVSVSIAVLADNKVSVQRWMKDLSSSMAIEFHDPSDCFDEERFCWKVSVVVREGKAIASAKEVLVS